MAIRRITYVLSLICALVFFVLQAGWFSFYLFVAILLLVPLDLLMSLPGIVTVKLKFSAPDIVDRHEEASIKVTIAQDTRFPTRGIKAKIRATSGKHSTVHTHTCGVGQNSKVEIALDTSQSGVLAYSLERLWSISLLGLFSLPKKYVYKASVLILPEPIKPTHVVELPKHVVLRPKPGGGFAEDHDLRQYQQGDPIRSIHWKVSAKLDSLIIREPLIPTPHSRLVRFKQWHTPDECNLILGRLRWVSDFLLKQDLAYYIKFGSHGFVKEITRHEDFVKYLYQELCEPDTVWKSSVPDTVRFNWELIIDAKP
jgi:uncharacterized protein (DUF58 family)